MAFAPTCGDTSVANEFHKDAGDEIMATKEKFVGQSVVRVEDKRFLTGAAEYVSDIKLEGLAHAAILRSPHPHARIVGIESARALAIPGVVAVITYADFANMATEIPLRLAPIPGFERFLQHPLANEKVRYVGEPVAVVIAENAYLAEDALSAVDVEFDPLPPVVSMDDAKSDQTLVTESAGTNIAVDYAVDHGDVAAAFADAPYTRRETFYCHRHGAVPMETRGFVASYDRVAEHLTVWGGTKVNFVNRRILAGMLDMPENNMNFIELDVGGGFGSRGEFYPEDFLIPFLAIKLGRPVKWIEDRREHLIAANHSREMACELEIATESDGTLRGMRGWLRADMGAYLRTNGGVVPAKAVQSLPGPYRLPAFGCHVEVFITNKTPVGTYRAPGRFEATFFRERLFDMAAADLGIDPVDFRARNLLTEAEMPYPIGKLLPYDRAATYDIGDAEPLLRRALLEIGMEPGAEFSGVLPDGRLRGVGCASAIDSTAVGPAENARIILSENGTAIVYTGLSAMGQGHQTSFAQICADEFGLPVENFAVQRTDTSHLEWGYGTFNSRGIVMGGSALVVTADKIKAVLIQVAGMRLNLAEDELEFRDGAVYRANDDDGDALMDIPELLAAREALGLDRGEGRQLDVSGTFEQTTPTHTYGAHATEVAVDPETGHIEILQYATTEDIGRCVNPMIVHGQTIGGVAQGVGGALLEEFVYGDDAQPLSTTFADYMLPSSMDVPHVATVTFENSPSAFNPLGVKGAGEGGIIAAGAALANAVRNALSDYDMEITALPLKPETIRGYIERSGH